MGGKRRAQPTGDAQGKAAQGGASRKRQTRGPSVDGTAAGSAGAGFSGQEDSGSTLSPVTMCFSMRCDPSALAGRKAELGAAVEAALRKVAAEFGGRECRVEWMRVGPSKDTLQRVLPLVLARRGAKVALQCFRTCVTWKRELGAQGFCCKTLNLCLDLAARHSAEIPSDSDLDSIGDSDEEESDPEETAVATTERALSVEAKRAFLKRSEGWGGSLHEWLQAASQEPDTSFLSRGAALTAHILGLELLQWVGGNPPGKYSGGAVNSVGFSPDGKRVVSGSDDGLVKLWNTETGARVISSLPHSGTKSTKLLTYFKNLSHVSYAPNLGPVALMRCCQPVEFDWPGVKDMN